MSPKKDKSAKSGTQKEVPGIFSDIKIDVNALDGHYNKGNTVSSDSYRPYTIFGEFGGGQQSGGRIEGDLVEAEEERFWAEIRNNYQVIIG